MHASTPTAAEREVLATAAAAAAAPNGRVEAASPYTSAPNAGAWGRGSEHGGCTEVTRR